MNKKELREHFKTLRCSKSTSETANYAAELTSQIIASQVWQEATSIMLYLAMPQEANLDAVIAKSLEEGKAVYVPVCTSKTEIIAARLISLDKLTRGVLGIRIPNEPYDSIVPQHLDLVLVPGLAFDKWGGRLGMGMGYYDRFLERVDFQKRIAVAYEYQVSENALPMEPHDARMAAIVTNKGMIWCHSTIKEGM